MQILDLSDTDALSAPMLEEIRCKVHERLRQIEPLIEEAERLRHVLAVIEERSRPGRLERRPHSRAPKGANKRAILNLIGRRPGITAAEIADITGLKRTVVASTVSRLKRYNELSDHEHGGLCLPGAAATPETSQSEHRRTRTDTGEDAGGRLAPAA